MRRKVYFLSQRYTNAQIDAMLAQRYTNAQIDAKLADLKNQLNQTGGAHGPIVDVDVLDSLSSLVAVRVTYSDGTTVIKVGHFSY